MKASRAADFPTADCWSELLLSAMRKVQRRPEAVPVAVAAAEIAAGLADSGSSEPCCSCYRCYTGW